jgi:hypothetical protein
MTPSTTNSSLVEHVSRELSAARYQARKQNKLENEFMAKAAIRATLEYLRDRVTDDMVLEGSLAMGSRVSSLNVEAGFRAMLSTALDELEPAPSHNKEKGE